MNAIEKKHGYSIVEMPFEYDGKHVYGQIYVPDAGNTKYPTVILAHGYSASHLSLSHFADYFAQAGFACYVFDFCGGGPNSRSDGKMEEMSVLTEVDDLNAVIDFVKTVDIVDADHLFMLGESQGGLVSALIAAKRPDDIRSLILFYPAFMIPEVCRNWKGKTLPPFAAQFEGRYIDDGATVYAYRESAAYPNNVLIVHGDQDELVDLKYAKQAEEIYRSAELQIISGGHHGFNGAMAVPIAEHTVEFMRRNLD